MVSIWPYHWLYRWEPWATPQILFSVPGQAVLELLDKQLWKSGMVHIICQLTCCTWPTAYLPASRAKCDLQHNSREIHILSSQLHCHCWVGELLGDPLCLPAFLVYVSCACFTIHWHAQSDCTRQSLLLNISPPWWLRGPVGQKSLKPQFNKINVPENKDELRTNNLESETKQTSQLQCWKLETNHRKGKQLSL